QIWDIATGTLSATIKLPSPVGALALNRESNLAAVACDDLTLRVADLDTLNVVRVFAGHENRVLDLCLSPDSRTLASSGLDGTIRLWDLPTGSAAAVVERLDSPATCLAFSPDGMFLTSAHVDRRGVVLWTDGAVFGLSAPASSASAELAAAAGAVAERAAAAAERSLDRDRDLALVRLSALPLSRVLLAMNLDDVK
ncbi:WD repeat-containing protein 36, partial [Cladochytrium tenue]